MLQQFIDFYTSMNHLYLLVAFIFNAGLYIMLVRDNLYIKLLGLGVFQVSILVFFITLGKVNNGLVPVLSGQKLPYTAYSVPLTQVLMLTAIVVGFATLSVGLALLINIKKYYGTVLGRDIQDHDMVAGGLSSDHQHIDAEAETSKGDAQQGAVSNNQNRGLVQ